MQRLEYFLGFGGQVALDSVVSFLPNSGARSARWWCKNCDTHWFEKLDTTIEDALKEALQRAQDWCSLQQQTIASHKVSEDDIIAYCAQNPALFARLQKALDYETKIVRERAPEIFAQWRYYQQFLQIQGGG